MNFRDYLEERGDDITEPEKLFVYPHLPGFRYCMKLSHSRSIHGIHDYQCVRDYLRIPSSTTLLPMPLVMHRAFIAQFVGSKGAPQKRQEWPPKESTPMRENLGWSIRLVQYRMWSAWKRVSPVALTKNNSV